MNVGIYLTEPPYGLAKVRQSVMLNAIGAQEALEAFGKTQPKPYHGKSAFTRWERARLALAGRRNAAEKPLRPDERAVWAEFQRGDESARARIRAVLEDTGK